MRTLVFSCPATGEAIDSKIEVEIATLPFAMLIDVPLRCPHCGERHVFAGRSGKLSQPG